MLEPLVVRVLIRASAIASMAICNYRLIVSGMQALLLWQLYGYCLHTPAFGCILWGSANSCTLEVLGLAACVRR
jgi:hypothetical protein